MLYPKINSLYKREKQNGGKLIWGDYACEEFASINRWSVTEKIDGTNVRIIYDQESPNIQIGGRTDKAQFPLDLLTPLNKMFSFSQMNEVFPEARKVILFGEGYGPKINSGGWYRKDPSFILFDVWIDGWWLERYKVEDIAQQLDINSVPTLLKWDGSIEVSSSNNVRDYWTMQEIVEYVSKKPIGPLSIEAQVSQKVMEGIVARAHPLMLFRQRHEPIMFKLKTIDFI